MIGTLAYHPMRGELSGAIKVETLGGSQPTQRES